jgi:hypothetical protein
MPCQRTVVPDAQVLPSLSFRVLCGCCQVCHSECSAIEALCVYDGARDPSTPLRFARDDECCLSGDNEAALSERLCELALD